MKTHYTLREKTYLKLKPKLIQNQNDYGTQL